MKRRTFLPATGAALAAAGSASAASSKGAIFELCRYQLRSNADNQTQRVSDFLSKIYFPALARAGAGPTGCFAPVIAEQSPFYLTVVSYPSLAAMEAIQEKLAADKEYQKESTSFFASPALPYVRMESSLLRAFNTMPAIEVPSTEGRQSPRIFELRTYESNHPATLAKKIQMFEEGGEIAIFRKTGLQPVFFGRMIVGPNMPNLTYLLAFDDLAAREKNWRTFVNHPEWQKLRVQPGYSDAEIVSNISNSILRPLPFSAIR
ncbi:MAG: NIPSNAP family protein [Bryobacteraceae bacterium]|nr:NIPSNAP family protein [Bryobacteraceae bacterium]